MQFSNISFSYPEFPDLLRNIANPPKSLNVLGTLSKGTYVAIVGTCKATAYCEKVTYQLAYELAAAGAVIVSGLAIGLDGIVELGFDAREAVPVSAQSPDEAKIIELLGTGQSTNDELISANGLPAAQFANIISLMEITGKIRNLGAGQWVRR